MKLDSEKVSAILMPSRLFQAECIRNPLKQGLEVIRAKTEGTEVMQEYSGRASRLGKNATTGREDGTADKAIVLQDHTLVLL